MITVVRIIDRLNVGGPALHAVLAAARLDPGRFRTLLLYGEIAPGEGDMAYLLAQHGVSAVPVPGLARDPHPLRDLRALGFLLRLLWRERPQVVHTHKSKAGLLGRLAAVACQVPVRVHTFHGHVLEGYFSPARTRGMVWMERALARLSTRLVTISPALRDDLCGRLGIAPPGRFAVVPLGLDLRPFRDADGRRGRLRAELRLAAGVPLIGVVGRLVPIKDHLGFLAALEALHRHGTPAHTVIVGGGELEGMVRAEIRRLGLAGRVHLLGWRRDLAPIYADLDLLCLSSRNEGTPVAAIEALAAGVPVVATAVGGVPDVLSGRAGRLVPPGDPGALAAALQAALGDAGLRAQARDPRQRDGVVAAYGVERLCRDLAALYEHELKTSAAGRSVPLSAARPEAKVASFPHQP